jgi:hypothetical protein
VFWGSREFVQGGRHIQGRERVDRVLGRSWADEFFGARGIWSLRGRQVRTVRVLHPPSWIEMFAVSMALGM